MRYSSLFAKTLKQPPKDADTVNHKLLTQAGYVNQLMAGVYSYLPLGLRVLRKIENIVREEMDNVGGREILMPVLHPKINWETTGGWEGIDVLFKIESRTQKQYALGQSEEEVVTPLTKQYVKSYQDLPLAVYQIHWKYRDELRAKSGILRGREFYMKDMYSFHETQEDFDRFYDEVQKAYLKIYSRLGLTAKVTEASGGSFSKKISYEFMILTEAGEDDIFYCEACDFCVNVEIAKVKEGDICPRCQKSALSMARASEAGNVFDLGQKYTKDFEFSVTAQDGSKKYPVMGCYGIGISRVMGIVVEKYHDDRGIIWPDTIAPYDVHLIGLTNNDPKMTEKVENAYKKLQDSGIEVLIDDRDIGAGQKFADADLIGIPQRLVISPKTGDKIEVKDRKSGKIELITIDQLIIKYNSQ